MPPQAVRGETNLCRAPGLWEPGPVQLELPFEARGIATLVRASGRLKLTPDLDVLAWISERWLSTPPLDLDGWARFTLYDLTSDLYQPRTPERADRKRIRESIVRLMTTLVTVDGYDARRRERRDEDRDRIATTSAPIVQLVSELERVGPDPRRLGALRGSTFAAQLAPWLCDQLAAGGYTYLDFSILRQLDGLAKRLWIYLEAERFKPGGDGRLGTHFGLGRPALASIGAGNYKRHRAARAALVRASRQIMGADDRYESVSVERRPGGWSLVAVKLDAEERRRKRAERERVRDALAEAGFSSAPVSEGPQAATRAT